MTSFSEKARDVIAAIAPTLGTALGGPLGALAGTMLSTALGGDSKAAETAILSGNPDALLKIKQAEMDFKAKIAELGVEEDKLHFDDVSNARNREVTVKDSTPRYLAYGIVVLVVVLEGLLLFHGQPVLVDGVVLGRIMGTLDSALMLVLSYYFGSSASSQGKTDALAKIAQMP